MKFYETHYEEYIHSIDQYNIHPEMIAIYEQFPKVLSQFGNLIVYGPPGSGKYSQVLYFLKKYSPSELKYDKKITCQTDKLNYNYHISDIHYEVDMALLGCNSKLLWHEVFLQIVDIVSVKTEKIGVIVCKNFHLIHNELLDIFYSYIQHYNHPSANIQIKFIIISEHVSFIPTNIVQACKLIAISRPEKQQYIGRIKDSDDHVCLSDNRIASFMHRFQHSYSSKSGQCIHKPYGENNSIQSVSKTKIKNVLDCLDSECIMNIKETESFSLMNDGSQIPKDNLNTICNNIIQELLQFNTLSFTQFRDNIYDILVYNLDIHECLWYIISYFIQRNILIECEIECIMEKMYVFLKQYNNNYRPIYHLESIFFFIITILQKKHAK